MYFSRQTLFSKTFQDNNAYSSTFLACANPVTVVNGRKRSKSHYLMKWPNLVVNMSYSPIFPVNCR